jgi:hypothetical protein
MLPVAAVIAGNSLAARAASWVAAGLFLAGAILMLLFQGVGARVPHTIDGPVVQSVWPLWRGENPLFSWRFGERFCRNLVSQIAAPAIGALPPWWQWLQFLPLVVAQIVAVGVAWWDCGPSVSFAGGARSDLNLGIDQQQQPGRHDQQSQDPETQAQ